MGVEVAPDGSEFVGEGVDAIDGGHGYLSDGGGM
jgi:hypothetical protein